ncbi:hypothetical protein INS49_003795 [Diaporthe citri]|uniref:uncharacterized protein n=1 Tax=Diaporthe citri TaxID=83186 RepID=UPI001C800BE3|nr:uncharacterized protein INS49_003795 [Diaporthe citri]KAG6355829.1 hypothetical protein INS49_003795 [Diaporthe citri]
MVHGPSPIAHRPPPSARHPSSPSSGPHFVPASDLIDRPVFLHFWLEVARDDGQDAALETRRPPFHAETTSQSTSDNNRLTTAWDLSLPRDTCRAFGSPNACTAPPRRPQALPDRLKLPFLKVTGGQTPASRTPRPKIPRHGPLVPGCLDPRNLPAGPLSHTSFPMPPRPVSQPDFMLEGFDNDDRWRMVEDEFYSVAARFTAHLHAAQYRRLKDEAKKQNPTIHTLARPVTRPPTLEVVRRQAASTLVASQRRAIATAKLHSEALGSASGAAPAAAAATAAQPDDEDTDRFQIQPPRKRTHLASLLDSPRKRAQPLTSTATSNGKARAAAISTSSQPSSLGIRTGTPSPSAKATHHKISMSTAKTAHARYGPRGIPEQAAVGSGLPPGLARSQSDHDSNVDDLEQHSARSYGTLQANHLTAAASRRTVTNKDISARDRGPQKPMSTDHASRTPTPQSAEVNDGSDSGSETYFQRRLRARRSKSKPQRGHRPTTPDEPTGREASQARPKSQVTSNAALAVPSV